MNSLILNVIISKLLGQLARRQDVKSHFLDWGIDPSERQQAGAMSYPRGPIIRLRYKKDEPPYVRDSILTEAYALKRQGAKNDVNSPQAVLDHNQGKRPVHFVLARVHFAYWIGEKTEEQIQGKAGCHERWQPDRFRMRRYQGLEKTAANRSQGDDGKQYAVRRPLLDQIGLGQEHGYCGAKQGIGNGLCSRTEQYNIGCCQREEIDCITGRMILPSSYEA
jgi:hypothetical protein